MTCTAQELRQVIAQHYNGSDHNYRHSMNPRMIYTGGVREVAQKAEAYWFLDWVAFHAVPVYSKAWEKGAAGVGIITLVVKANRTGNATLSLEDGQPPAATLALDFTDFPEGEWKFYLCTDMDGESYISTMCLPAER